MLVHCHAGISRSATIVIAYLMKALSMTLEEAYKLVKSRRPRIKPNQAFISQLMEYEKEVQTKGLKVQTILK